MKTSILLTRLKGRIKGVDGQSILMTLDGQEKDVYPSLLMPCAKLVMNDELIAFSADQLKAMAKSPIELALNWRLANRPKKMVIGKGASVITEDINREE